jgi:hypothetical protein
MESKIALALLCCAVAGSYSAQAAPGKPEQVNLDAKEGAEYFHFPEGAQLKVTNLVCPPNVTVSVTCRTAAHGRCGKWYLGLNQTAKSGASGDTGIASLDYSGPENCNATVVVQSP